MRTSWNIAATRSRLPLSAFLIILSMLGRTSLARDEVADLIEEARRRGETEKHVTIEQYVLSEFLPKEFVYDRGLTYTDDLGRITQHRFAYRLHVPDEIKPGERYPLILWLAGCGWERGWDNKSQLQYMEKTVFQRGVVEARQFYVLVPQGPLKPRNWYGDEADSQTGKAKGQDDDMLSVAMAILEKTVNENPIDPERITLVGISCGASACWEMGIRYPDKWAAIASFSPSSLSVQQAMALPKCPIWIFNNSYDDEMTTESFQELDDMITIGNDGGADIAQTMLHDEKWKHDSWSLAFQEYDLLTWLLTQHRGMSSWSYPPGVKPTDWPWKQPLKNWTTFQILSQFVVVFSLFVIAVYLWSRRSFLSYVISKKSRILRTSEATPQTQ